MFAVHISDVDSHSERSAVYLWHYSQRIHLAVWCHVWR